jgi:hypothetical protein
MICSIRIPHAQPSCPTIAHPPTITKEYGLWKT